MPHKFEKYICNSLRSSVPIEHPRRKRLNPDSRVWLRNKNFLHRSLRSKDWRNYCRAITDVFEESNATPFLILQIKTMVARLRLMICLAMFGGCWKGRLQRIWKGTPRFDSWFVTISVIACDERDFSFWLALGVRTVIKKRAKMVLEIIF